MKDEIAARLRAIRGRTEVATDGPWLPHKGSVSWGVTAGPLGGRFPVDTPILTLHARSGRGYGDPQLKQDAAFIAAARDDVPYLLGVADAAQAFLGLFLADEGCGVDTCEAALTLLRAFGGETEGDGE